MTTTATMLPGFTGELYEERHGNSYATSAALAYALVADGTTKTRDGYPITWRVIWGWRIEPGFPENGDVRTEQSVCDHAALVQMWAVNEGLI